LEIYFTTLLNAGRWLPRELTIYVRNSIIFFTLFFNQGPVFQEPEKLYFHLRIFMAKNRKAKLGFDSEFDKDLCLPWA